VQIGSEVGIMEDEEREQALSRLERRGCSCLWKIVVLWEECLPKTEILLINGLLEGQHDAYEPV
jgi:hypothetical protein